MHAPRRRKDAHPRATALVLTRGVLCAAGILTSGDVPIYTLPRGAVRTLVDDATEEALVIISREFADGQHTKPSSGEMPLVAGSLAEALSAVLERHPGRLRVGEEDTYHLKVFDALSNLETERSGTPWWTPAWGLQFVEADQCWGKGAAMHVHVLDTGIRTFHQEFGGPAFAGVEVAAPGTYLGILTVCSAVRTMALETTMGTGPTARTRRVPRHMASRMARPCGQ